jgi:hypothetical protein
MESAPQNTGGSFIDYRTAWIDPARFILAGGGKLFRGDLSSPFVDEKLLPDFLVGEFAWRWIPVP